MNILKLKKYGINPANISSAKQLSDIYNAIEADERKISLNKHYEAMQNEQNKQREEKRHQEDVQLAKESNELNKRTLKIAIWAFIISVISFLVSLVK